MANSLAKIRGENTNFFRNISIVVGIILLDRITKMLTVNGNILFDSKFLSFTFVQNTGVSFGMFKGFNPYLIWIYLIVLGEILFYFDKVSKQDKIPILFVVGGLIGNFVDRVAFGYVIDFIDFHWWPVFNIADSFIVIGVFWIIINSFLEKK